MKTQIIPASPDGIASAAAILAAGGLVAMPTETVYGLAGDARSDTAVARIFDAKARPRFNPLIVHVPDLAVARRYAVFDTPAEMLAAAFWPGALTLVLPLRPDAGLSPLVTNGLESVAIRVPMHPVARALLRAFDGPLAAPSANPSGRISPTRADHVLDGLSGRIAAVLDGGPCAVGIESTIIGLVGTATLLRPGGIAAEAIEAVLHQTLATAAHGPITAPGQLQSHYAPTAMLRLDATAAKSGEIFVGFGQIKGDLTLSSTGDLVVAAAALFHMLRTADAMAGANGRIAFAPVPDHGLGRAINDRLRRAAAPRPASQPQTRQT